MKWLTSRGLVFALLGMLTTACIISWLDDPSPWFYKVELHIALSLIAVLWWVNARE